MTIRQFHKHLPAVFFVISICFSGLAHANSASKMVQNFQATLLDVMKSADQTPLKQRYDQLAPKVAATFHLPLMTQIATGRYWQNATVSEKSAAVGGFRRMSVATLATLFDGYSGESFAVTGEGPGPSKTTIVATKLTKSDESQIEIAYVARQFGGQWRLIDVVVDGGISELKVRRSEYHLILKKRGMAGLIELLNNKADELMSQ